MLDISPDVFEKSNRYRLQAKEIILIQEKGGKIAENQILVNVEKEFETLKEKLAHDKNKDLQTFNDEIKELIAEEIIGRYYYTKGRIQYALQFDPNIEKAIDVLNSPETYASILDGSFETEEE